jgi:hypothetical protein
LEEAVAAEPEDPTAVAVWADALSAAGSPLGELLQIFAADPDVRDLRWRNHVERLLTAYGAWWYGPLETAQQWQRGALPQRRRALPVDRRLHWPPVIRAPAGMATTHAGLVRTGAGTVQFLRALAEKPTACALTSYRLTGPVLPPRPLAAAGLRSLRVLEIGAVDHADRLGRIEGDTPPRLETLVLRGADLSIGRLVGGLHTLVVAPVGACDLAGLVDAELPALTRLEVVSEQPVDLSELAASALGRRLGDGLLLRRPAPRELV